MYSNFTKTPAAEAAIAAPGTRHRMVNTNGMCITSLPTGAAIQSLLVPNRYGNPVDVVLGYNDDAGYQQDDYYMGTIIGRFANRIAGNNVVLNGNTYTLNSLHGSYHHHGGKSGFNKKQFTTLPATAINGEQAIRYRYTSADLEEGYPGELQLDVTYTLTGNNAWIVEYNAFSSKTTLINLTQHAYFNLTGNPSTLVDEHELLLPAQWYLPVTDLQVPSGKIEPVEGTAFDFTTFKQIGKDIHKHDEQLLLSCGYDHSFVLERQHTHNLKHAASVRENSSGIRMDVYTTEPSVHFYSGNFLNNVKGKKNTLYNRRSGFCLETQHFPDAPNHPHFPSTILQAGEAFYSKTIFKFSIF
ncbi:MAG TPA: aldose epimerase family protein [Ferruginibacter sp.]|nr:aldose epimerase family protein [Ferruginibacter sp.]HMP22321.1 aldose epimerase family protein [Ferruginibacter sp.]